MTNTELWNKLNSYIKEHDGKFPSKIKYAEYSGLDSRTVDKIYAHWLQQGRIARKNNIVFCFPNEVENKLDFVDQEPTEEEIAETVKKQKFSAMRIIAFVIGSALLLCSIHFTYDFNKMAMDKTWAFLLSFSTVCFMSIAFALRMFIKNLNMKFFIVFLWFIGITYSVFTAVSGQYNEFRKYAASDVTEITENTNSVINKTLRSLETKRDSMSYWRQEELHYTVNPDLKIENPQTWRQIQKNVAELANTEKQIEELQLRLLENASTNTTETETVYHWIAGAFGTSQSKIQFLMILFPALFIDLCSSVCFSFAFKREEE